MSLIATEEGGSKDAALWDAFKLGKFTSAVVNGEGSTGKKLCSEAVLPY